MTAYKSPFGHAQPAEAIEISTATETGTGTNSRETAIGCPVGASCGALRCRQTSCSFDLRDRLVGSGAVDPFAEAGWPSLRLCRVVVKKMESGCRNYTSCFVRDRGSVVAETVRSPTSSFGFCWQPDGHHAGEDWPSTTLAFAHE